MLIPRHLPLAIICLTACAGPAAPAQADSVAAPVTPGSAAALASAAAARAAAVDPLPGFGRGHPDAPVVVVEFTDFGCRWCGELARTTLPVIERELIAAGQVRWIVIPVATASTPRSLEAAAAAECAAEQQRAWPMHDRLFARPREWMRASDPERRFLAYARELGLDTARFAACYRDPRTAAAVATYRRLARQMGVRVAPTMLVNGRRVEGALPLHELERVLRAAGTAAGLARRAGRLTAPPLR